MSASSSRGVGGSSGGVNYGSGVSSSSSSSLFLLVTTSHPSSSKNGGGGSLTWICPKTGTVVQSSSSTASTISGGDLQQSSSSPNKQVGVTTLSLFPTTSMIRSHQQTSHPVSSGVGWSSSSSSSSSSYLAMAYGTTTNPKKGNAKDDAFAMLLTIRNGAASPAAITHWKCRLPESLTTAGLLVSPVTNGRHIVGGGVSGTIYVWDVFAMHDDGSSSSKLIRTIPRAHYRAITCMIWSTTTTTTTSSTKTAITTTSPCDCHLVTGGDDGMVHVYSHIDLVVAGDNTNDIQPFRTWTKHQLSVTALVAMPGSGRLASASDDGQIVIMEICSGMTLAVLSIEDGIRSLFFNNDTQSCCLYAGTVCGNIHIIDWDAYALYKTNQLSSLVGGDQTTMGQHKANDMTRMRSSANDQVFGVLPPATNTVPDHSNANSNYRTQLRGHDRPVTAMACYFRDNREYLVSGDAVGTIRVWEDRCCVRVVRPWSQQQQQQEPKMPPPSTTSGISSSSGNSNNKKQKTEAAVSSHHHHPVTSIQLIHEPPVVVDGAVRGPQQQGSSSMLFGNFSAMTNKNHLKKKNTNFMVSPLQNFATTTGNNANPISDEAFTAVRIPFLEPRHREPSRRLADFDFEAALLAREQRRRRRKQRHQYQQETAETSTENVDVAEEEEADSTDRVSRLEREVAEAKVTIRRWQVVNNQLMLKLQASQQAQK